MQFALREPYANGFLHRLNGAPRLLEICGLPCAPSGSAYSKFKKKLVEIPDFMDYIDKIIADVFLECGEEIERLRDAGCIPEDTPPLGEALTMDSTDIMAWARSARTSRKTGKEVLSKDPDAKWGHRTAKNRRSSKISGKGGRKKPKSAANQPSVTETTTARLRTTSFSSATRPTLLWILTTGCPFAVWFDRPIRAIR